MSNIYMWNGNGRKLEKATTKEIWEIFYYRRRGEEYIEKGLKPMPFCV